MSYWKGLRYGAGEETGRWGVRIIAIPLCFIIMCVIGYYAVVWSVGYTWNQASRPFVAAWEGTVEAAKASRDVAVGAYDWGVEKVEGTRNAISKGLQWARKTPGVENETTGLNKKPDTESRDSKDVPAGKIEKKKDEVVPVYPKIRWYERISSLKTGKKTEDPRHEGVEKKSWWEYISSSWRTVRGEKSDQ